MRVRKIVVVLKDYGDHSSICGFRYLSQDGRTLVERLFWLVVLAGCCFASYRLTKSSYYAYKHHPVSFAAETDYLHWNTSFPQIVVCEVESASKVPNSADFVRKYFPEYKNDWKFAAVIHNAVFEDFCQECEHYCNGKNTPVCDDNFNFKEVANKVKLPCEKLMKNCVWNGRPFDCCSKFETVDTERGVCFLANPRASQSKPPMMVINKNTASPRIEFEVTRSVQVYLIAPDDTLSLNAEVTTSFIAKKSMLCELVFTVKDMKNDDRLVYEDFDRRKCKFPHESWSKRFDTYSQPACIVDCRAYNQLMLCNCTHPNMPKSESTMCNVQGLACLDSYALLLRGFRLKGAAYRPGMECDCPSSCVEPEYNVAYKECVKQRMPGVYGSIKIQAAGIPTERFKRNLIRSKLDLVVSIGGIAGLFLGASLLSAAEIVIIFCIRPFSKRFHCK